MSNERKQRAERAEQMRKEREKADRRQRNVISIAIVGVVVALIAVGGWAIKSASDENRDNTKLVAPANTNDDFGFIYDAEDAGAKPGKNPATVILTEDFQCPACGQFEAANGAWLDQKVESGEIVIEYRLISFLDSQSGNDYSSRAANAALCVLDDSGAGAYKAMHDLLYARQPAEGTNGPTDDDLIATAADAGVTGIDTCIKQKTFGPWIDKALDGARDADFPGTPWVRIGGETVDASQAAMQAAIDAERGA